MALLRRFFVKTTGHDVALPISVNTGAPLLDKSSPHLRSGDTAQLRYSPQPQEIHQDGSTQKAHFLQHSSVRSPQTELPFNAGVHTIRNSPVNSTTGPSLNGASDCNPCSFTPRVNHGLEPPTFLPRPSSFRYPFEQNDATSERAAQTHVPDVVISPSIPTAFTGHESQQGYSSPSSESVTASLVSNASTTFFSPLKPDFSSNCSIRGPTSSDGSVSRSSHNRTRSLTGAGASRAHEERELHHAHDQPSGGIHRRRSSSVTASINMSWEAIASSLLDTPPSSSEKRHPIVIPTSLSCLWETESTETGGKAPSIPYDTRTLINQKSGMDGTSTGVDISIDRALLPAKSKKSNFEGTKQPDVVEEPEALSSHLVGPAVSSGPNPAQEVEPPYTDVFDLDIYYDPTRWSRYTQTRRSICSISTNTSSSMSKYSTSTNSIPDIEKTPTPPSPASSISSRTILSPHSLHTCVSETKLNVSDSIPVLPDIYRLRRQGFVPPSSSTASLRQEIIRDKDHYRSSAYSRPAALVTEPPSNRIRILSTSSSVNASSGIAGGDHPTSTFSTGQLGMLKPSASTFMVPRKPTPVVPIFTPWNVQNSDASSTHISGAQSSPALKPRITFEVPILPPRVAKEPTVFLAGTFGAQKEVKPQRRVLKKRTRPIPKSHALSTLGS